MDETPDSWTMADIVRRHAAQRPEQTALVFNNTALSYRELDQLSSRIANGLSPLVNTGDGAAGSASPRAGRVAVLDFNSSRYMEVFFGIAKLGCVLVGVNVRLAAPEVLYILRDSGSAALFVDRDHYALVESIESEIESVRQVIALDGGHPRWPSFEQWRDAQCAEDPGVALSEYGDVVQLYTSGTTGQPKGVCHSNRTWRLMSEACRAGWGVFGTDTVSFVCMPSFHVAGFNSATLTLLEGGTAVLSRRVDVEEILEIIPKYGITDILFVPAVILAIVSHPKSASTNFSSLRNISYGAAPIAEDLLRQARELFGCSFFHLYGMTENLGVTTFLPPEMHRAELGKVRSCGRSYPGLELKVVDASGAELPPWQVGEVVVRCAWIMRGYWRNEPATSETVRSGWLHSGDAGYLDDDGFLYLHDRVKDMIVTGGENVYPAEVENALFGHPSIADVAVIGIPDDKWGEAIKAIIVLQPGATLDVQGIMEFARPRIAGFKLPKSIDVVDALPRNASGKVLRRALRVPYWSGRARLVN